MRENPADPRIRLLPPAGFYHRRSVGLLFAAHVDFEVLSRGPTLAARVGSVDE